MSIPSFAKIIILSRTLMVKNSAKYHFGESTSENILFLNYVPKHSIYSTCLYFLCKWLNFLTRTQTFRNKFLKTLKAEFRFTLYLTKSKDYCIFNYLKLASAKIKRLSPSILIKISIPITEHE